MRQVYAHVVHAVLTGGDARAIGGAITMALCGAYEHPPPCRWPHHTGLEESCALPQVAARVVFVCAPEEVSLVRDLIATAVGAGWLDGPTGRSTWTVERQVVDEPTEADRGLAADWL